MALAISLGNSGVERLKVEPIEQPTKLTVVPQAEPSEPSPPSVTHSTPAPSKYPAAAVLAVLRAIAIILAVRFQLLLALAGAFVLALLAMNQQSYIGLAVLSAYCVLTVIPLVWLAWPNRYKA